MQARLRGQEELNETLDEMYDRLLAGQPPERLLKHVPVEERLRGLPAEERLRGLSAEERQRLRELLDLADSKSGS